jgi:methyltransferase (TIGR00027 family)
MAGQASKTAQGVAVVRSRFPDRPHTPSGDPDAQERLCAGMRVGRALRLHGHLLARTRFFDTVVLEALRRGIDQVVIVGAGYDDRALRFRSPGVRFFELDHPDTQADKRRRVEALGADLDGLVFVPLDVTRDPVAELLADAGHEASRATLFLCEGIVIYLEMGDIVYLLRGLAERAAPSSELAISLAVHPDGMSSQALVKVLNGVRGSKVDEPWRTILSEAAHLSLIRQGGWDEFELLTDAEFVSDASPLRSRLVRAAPIVLDRS